MAVPPLLWLCLAVQMGLNIERSCCGLETSPRGLGAGRSRSSGEWYRSDIGQWVIVARVFAIDGNKMINQPSLVFLVGYVLTYEVW